MFLGAAVLIPTDSVCLDVSEKKEKDLLKEAYARSDVVSVVVAIIEGGWAKQSM
jgi:hypothetical protein